MGGLLVPSGSPGTSALRRRQYAARVDCKGARLAKIEAVAMAAGSGSFPSELERIVRRALSPSPSRMRVLRRSKTLRRDLLQARASRESSFPERARLSTGEVIVRQGESGDEVFLIVEWPSRGVARSRDGAKRVLRQMEAGEVFGEMALLASARFVPRRSRRSKPTRAASHRTEISSPSAIGGLEAWMATLTRALAQRVVELEASRSAPAAPAHPADE